MTELEKQPPERDAVGSSPSAEPSARDIHDGICQLMTSLLAELQQASTAIDQTPLTLSLRQHLARAISLSEQAMALETQNFALKQRYRDDTLPEPLTDREKEVLERAATGSTNSRIASELTVSETTVRTHLRRTFKKLNVQDRTSAVTTAIASGWIAPPTNAASSP